MTDKSTIFPMQPTSTSNEYQFHRTFQKHMEWSTTRTSNMIQRMGWEADLQCQCSYLATR